MTERQTEQLIDRKIAEKALEADPVSLLLYSQRKLAQSNLELAAAMRQQNNQKPSSETA